MKKKIYLYLFSELLDKNKFQRQFLDVIDGAPSSMEFPKKPSFIPTDEQLQMERNVGSINNNL